MHIFTTTEDQYASNLDREHIRKLKTSLLAARILHHISPLLLLFGASYAKETLYQGMLYQACRSLKVPVPPLYPVRGASNYTLLYLIFRILTELPVRKALELGAGQSSLLIDAVAKIQPTLDAVTLETEADWAGRIRNRVAHQIVQSSLQQIKHDGDLVTSYTDLEQLGGRNFDLVVVDGPRGNRRKSRWAALEVLERYLASEFVVIFDDAERGGEQDTIQAFMERHTGCVDFWMLHGKNSQFVAFTPCYGAVKYF